MKDSTVKEQNSTLKADLDARRSSWEATASEEVKTIYNKGVLAVRQAATTFTALQPGNKAVDFELGNAIGKLVRLGEVLKHGPVILTWYRGGWCPYCNITLQHLQQNLPDFKNAGARLIALTPELPDNALTTQEKNQLQFEVLSDVNNEVARKYGLVFRLTSDVAHTYKRSFDLANYNGNDSHELPLAATYVIDTEGIIRYAFLDAEYRNRAEPKDILEVLEALK